jgi:opacity protein-like surface antigen
LLTANYEYGLNGALLSTRSVRGERAGLTVGGGFNWDLSQIPGTTYHIVGGPVVRVDAGVGDQNNVVTFANGSFYGTEKNWAVFAGWKTGVEVNPLFYGLAGVSFMNQNLKINFGGPVTNVNTTVPGFTFGFGIEEKLAFLSLPVSVFVEYQHTIWQDASLSRPAASPLFNYTFRRDDDTIRAGLNFYLTPPPAPVEQPRYVKAPRLK